MIPRICFVFSTFPPLTMGGVQRYLLTISKELTDRGFHPTILTRHYPTLRKSETFPTYSILRIGINPIPFSHNKGINSLTIKLGDILTYSLLGYPEARKQAAKSIIVHSQFAILSDVVLAHRIARKSKRRHIVTVHTRFGTEPEDFPLTRSALSLLRHMDHIIVNRKGTLVLLNDNGFENVSYLSNPISCDFYKPPTNTWELKEQKEVTRVLFIGRLVERRGPLLALKAFEKAVGRYPDLELNIVGTGEQESLLKRNIKQMKLEGKVNLVGESLDVRPYLWISDIFLSPSSFANSPSIALREAMASGLAIVATDVEETNTIVEDGRTGLIAQVDPDSIAECIVKLSENKTLQQKLGKQAISYARQNLDVTRYVDRLIEIYKGTFE